jgi:hypothetical protein
MRLPNHGGGAPIGPMVCGGGRAKLMHLRLSMVGGRSTELETYMTSRDSLLAGTEIQTFALRCSAIQRPE